jgi:hypothetical protein
MFIVVMTSERSLVDSRRKRNGKFISRSNDFVLFLPRKEAMKEDGTKANRETTAMIILMKIILN